MIHTLLRMTALCLLLGLALGCTTAQYEVADYSESDIETLTQVKSGELFLEGLIRLPGNSGFYLEANKIKDLNSRLNKARQDLAKNRNIVRSYKTLAYRRLLEGNPKGVSVYLRILKTRGKRIDLESAHILGLAYMQTGNKSKGRKVLIRAHRMNPNNFVVNINLGMYYYHRREIRRAIAYFSQARRARPDSSIPLIQLGAAYMVIGKVKRAKLAFEKALDIFPGNPLALYNIGLLNRYFDRDKDTAYAIFKGIDHQKQYPLYIRREAQVQIHRFSNETTYLDPSMILLP